MNKIQEYHDYLLEDNETLIPPIFMEGYVEPKQNFSFKLAIESLPVQIRAMAFGLTFALIGAVSNWIGLSR